MMRNRGERRVKGRRGKERSGEGEGWKGNAVVKGRRLGEGREGVTRNKK